MSLFRNKCGGCGKRIDSYATNKLGDLPLIFCGGPCHTLYVNTQRMIENKDVTTKYARHFNRKPIKFEKIKSYDGTTGVSQ